jgi:hypothetical protein
VFCWQSAEQWLEWLANVYWSFLGKRNYVCPRNSNNALFEHFKSFGGNVRSSGVNGLQKR